MQRVLGIYVKHPVPGQVKTRLAAALGVEKATELYRAFLRDLVERFRSMADRRFLCFAPRSDEAEAWFRDLAGPDYELWPQPEGTLEPRLKHFFQFAQEQGADQTVVVGSDSPTLPLGYLEKAYEHLNESDCVLGPATDGGYYLLGLRKPLPIFSSIEWSTPQVLNQTVARLEQAQASLKLLPPWYDVDTAEDWELLRGHLPALILAQDPLIKTLAHTRGILENSQK